MSHILTQRFEFPIIGLFTSTDQEGEGRFQQDSKKTVSGLHISRARYVIVNDTRNGYVSNRVLKIQVGFLLNEGVGQSRDTEFDVPWMRVSNDLMLNYLRGVLHLSRTSRGILVQGTLKTSLQGECARCLSDMSVNLDIPIEELFVYPPEAYAEFTLTDDGILDLAPLLREEIILDTPIGVLCKPDCAGLCPVCGGNLNQTLCECEREDVDPRFAALKRLKDEVLKE